MRSRSAQYSPEEVKLLRSVPKDAAVRLGAARAVVAAYTEPGGVATLERVAEVTGFSEAMVREIVSSPDWDELVAQAIMQVTAPIVHRGALRLAQIIDNEESSPSLVMQAQRIALNTYDIVMRHRTAQSGQDKDAALEAFLKSLPAADAVVRSTPEVLDGTDTRR